jgi:hypothetical protein
MTDLTKEDMRDLIREQTSTLASIVRPNASAPAPSAGSSLSGSVPGLGVFNTAVDKASSGLAGLYKGSVNVSTAFDTFNQAMSKVPGIGAALSSVGSSAQDMVMSTYNVQQDLQKSGANFNQDLTGMAKQVTGAGMSLEQYRSVVANNSENLAGLGSTVNRSQENFLLFGKNLRESGVIQQLTKLGMSTDDINNIMVTSAYKRYNMDLSSERSQRQLTESAQELAVSMEQNTRLYGTSREAQIKEQQSRLDNVQIQAELMHLDEAAQDRYRQMNSELDALGPAVKDLTDEIFTGGIRTQRGTELISALGPAGAELEQAVMMQKNAVTDQQKAEAQAAMERAKVSVLEYQKTEAFRDQITLVTGGLNTASKDIMTGSQEALRATSAKVKEIETAGKEPLSPEEAAAQMKKEVTGEMTGVDREGRPLDKTSIELAHTIAQSNAALLDQTAGLNVNMDNLVNSNKELNETIKQLNDSIVRQSPEQAAEMQKNIVPEAMGKIKDYLGVKPSQSVEDMLKVPEFKQEYADGTPNFQKFLDGGLDFNGMFEKFSSSGTPALLHGEEIVANKAQMQKLFSKFDFTEQFKSLGDAFSENKPADAQSIAASTRKILPQFDDIGNSIVNELSKIIPLDTSSIKEEKKLEEEKTGDDSSFFDDLTSFASDLVPTGISDAMFGIGDEFGNLYDKLTGAEKPVETDKSVVAPKIDTTNIKSSLAEIKKPEEPKVSMSTLGAGDDAAALKAKYEAEQSGVLAKETQKATPVPQEQPKVVARSVSLNDVYDILVELNNNIGRMTEHTEAINEASNKQIKETQRLSGNRFG